MKLSTIIKGTLAILIVAACKSNSFNYSIDDYKLTLEPRYNSNDVKACMEITYQIETGNTKSDGFKFVGTSKVDSLICKDETGIIASNIEYLKETKLNWQFRPVNSGLKKIKVEFVLRDFVINNGGIYKIEAPWAKVFRVPVKNAKFQVCFPALPASLKFLSPQSWDKDTMCVGSCYTAEPTQTNKCINLQYVF